MIQDQVRQAMSAEADRLTPPTDLAETVIARGRRVRRTRRVGLGVAIVTGIAAAAVLPGALIQSTREDPAVTPTPSIDRNRPVAPFKALPKGPSPRLPYTIGTSAGGGYLYDGETRVRLLRGLEFSVRSRIDGGWLVDRSDSKSNGVLGIKRPNGTFTPLAAPSGARAAVSRDGSHVVFPSRDRKRLVVADLGTLQQTASTPIDSNTELLGWNTYGIWFVKLTPTGAGATTWVWRPGSQPTLVSDAHELQVERSSTRMIRLFFADGSDQRCADVVTLGSGDRLEIVRRFCINGLDIDSASLSPDGRIILLPDGSAHPVDGGKAVQNRTPVGMSLFMRGEAAHWENNSNVLLEESGNERPFNYSVVRCDVLTGRCERAVDQRPPPGTMENGTSYFSVAYR